MEVNDTYINMSITRGPIRGKDRGRVGLIIKIQTRRDVEEFMTSLAQGRRAPVDAVGDMWYNCAPDAEPLEYYESDTKFDIQRLYTLDNVAGPLLIGGQNDPANIGRLRPVEEMMNLSFLRLAGISNESGVTLGILGAYSNDYIRRMRLILPKAVTQFLQDYIVPVTLNLQVISKG